LLPFSSPKVFLSLRRAAGSARITEGGRSTGGKEERIYSEQGGGEAGPNAVLHKGSQALGHTGRQVRRQELPSKYGDGKWSPPGPRHTILSSPQPIPTCSPPPPADTICVHARTCVHVCVHVCECMCVGACAWVRGAWVRLCE
jgi:hypothetical protein